MIRTPRLTLRQFTEADAPDVQRLAGAREVALNTLLIPHPYPDGAAAAWIAQRDARREHGNIALAIDCDGDLVGAVGLHIDRDHDRGEIGYWIGLPFWGNGYATEAARGMVRIGFEHHALQRIFAIHFTRNPASGRVLQKIGMRHEGSMRRHVKKWDEYIDVECYGILREEWTK